MTAPPTFASVQDHIARVRDVAFWWPYVAEILERHGLVNAGSQPVAGFNAMYPTFIYGDVVVKLFGYSRSWRKTHAAERAAHALVATDREIAAPSLVAEGQLYEGVEAPWPYLVTTRMPGVAWQDADLSTELRISIAAELGSQIRRVLALHPLGVARDDDCPALNVAGPRRKFASASSDPADRPIPRPARAVRPGLRSWRPGREPRVCQERSPHRNH